MAARDLRALLRRSRLALVASVVVAVTACGGGSGGGAAKIANVAPTPAFTVTPTSGAAPLSVTFDATSSNDPDGTITAYSWQFGDDTLGAVGGRATHVYSTPGNFRSCRRARWTPT